MVQKIITHELERNLASGERLDEATAEPPAPRSKPDPQLMGPPQSKLLNLDMQIQGC